MINPFHDTDWHPNRAKLQEFACSLIIGFPALAAVFATARWLGSGSISPGLLWLGLGGAVLGIVLWILPPIARPFYFVWYFVACCIGIIVSNTLLAAFYFLVLTPIGFAMRCGGRDPMTRRFDPQKPSYWVEAEKSIAPERYFRQF